jgi:hypothetical protein
LTAPASPYGRAPSSGFRTVFSFDIAPLDLAIYAVRHRLAVGVLPSVPELSTLSRVLGFGLLIDGNVGICIFPESEEIPI